MREFRKHVFDYETVFVPFVLGLFLRPLLSGACSNGPHKWSSESPHAETTFP